MSLAFLEAVHADPWAEEFIDLQSLNARVSEAIEQRVQRAREIARSEPRSLRSSSLVVLGPPGAGKTHLFARLRRRLGPRAVLVHIRPLIHAEITPRFLLSELVRQLGYSTHGLLQISALVGSLLAHLSGADSFFPRAFLSEYESLSEAEREARLESALEQVLTVWPEADESYLRRLLAAPFAKGAMQRSLLAWLSGRDCDVTQLERIGATASLGEELSLGALRTLSAVAAFGAPIVIVFDQLENLVDAQGPGARLLGYANLTSELVDSMRGLVLVHMALDTEWARGIEPALNLSQRSRLLMHRETLALPTTNEREALLSLWLDRIPNPAAAFPWPFNERQVSKLCKQPGLTPRMLLLECRRALSGEIVDSETDGDEFTTSNAQLDLEAEWQERLNAARALADEAARERSCLEPARLTDGLLACARFITQGDFSTAGHNGGAHLVLERDGQRTRIAFLHQSNPKSLATALGKLCKLAAQERIVAIRERDWELSPNWKDTLRKQNSLLRSEHARWVWLERDDAIRLLALDAFLQSARSGDVSDARGYAVTEESVQNWAADTLQIADWKIVREVLGQAASAE